MGNSKCTAKKLNAALDAGKTVVIANYLHAWKVTAKTRDKFAKAGIALFRDRNGLEMAKGRHYDDISYCSIRIY